MAGSVSMEGTGRISDFGNATEKEGAAGIGSAEFLWRIYSPHCSRAYITTP
jgi:hypothetical protein